MKRIRFLVVASALLSASICLAPIAARAEASGGKKAGDSFKEIGKEFKEFGKKVGEAGKEGGLQVAEFAKRVWYKSWKVSKPKLDEVDRSTRAFWREVIEGRDRTLEEMRRENAELKRRLSEGKD
ncbi:MAG TPA: hypothetical protein VGK94_09300 [Candidatus Polarisedimenticolia bacterium]|jgi:hypothetical protein